VFFHDRAEAGRKLAEKLIEYKNRKDAVVLGLPRGGVVVASEVARILGLQFDVVIPRKISAPGDPEYAIGAICEDGQGVFNQTEIRNLGVTPEYLTQQIEKEKTEIQRRLMIYRAKRPPLVLVNRIIILVDDGIATGLTMLAAAHYVLNSGPRKVVIAVPVGSQETIKRLEANKRIDEIVCLFQPSYFRTVGAFYQIFKQVEDEEVVELMAGEKPL